MLHTIGPVWDGNEVWLIVAGGAHLRRLPGVVRDAVLRLLSRALPDPRRAHRARRRVRVLGQGRQPALAHALGVGDRGRQRAAGAAVGRGLGEHRPRRADRAATASSRARCFDLLKPYALLGGVATLVLFLAHGAVFLSLRTHGDMVERARAPCARWRRSGGGAWCSPSWRWTIADQSDRGGVDGRSPPCCAVGAVALRPPRARGARPPARRGRSALTRGVDRRSSSARSSSTSSRTRWSRPPAPPSTSRSTRAASSRYTLKVMTVVAVLLVPFVLLYQGWTYWVFRRRVSAEDFGDVRTPLDLLDAARVEPKAGGPAASSAPAACGASRAGARASSAARRRAAARRARPR